MSSISRSEARQRSSARDMLLAQPSMQSQAFISRSLQRRCSCEVEGGGEDQRGGEEERGEEEGGIKEGTSRVTCCLHNTFFCNPAERARCSGARAPQLGCAARGGAGGCSGVVRSSSAALLALEHE